MKTMSGLGFPHIESCFALGDADVGAAVVSREATQSLLAHLASIAKPNEGAPKILLVFARMAASHCDWLDGELRVEVVGDGAVSVIEVMTELGGGLRERAMPSLRVPVPLDEFVRAVERVPRMIEPLIVKSRTDRKLALVSRVERTGRSLPPAPVAIAEEHLIELPPTRPLKPPSKLPPKLPQRPAPRLPPRPAPKAIEKAPAKAPSRRPPKLPGR
jgi:hypothetical protein